jgi:hypothetical protein
LVATHSRVGEKFLFIKDLFGVFLLQNLFTEDYMPSLYSLTSYFHNLKL